jgi:DNA-binding protein HU-beta
MPKTLTKSQVIGTIADKCELPKKQINNVLEQLVTLAYKEAKNTFTIPGLGKLVLVNRKARMGRNPQTGQPIKIPAKRVVKFRIAKAAKDSILGKR